MPRHLTGHRGLGVVPQLSLHERVPRPHHPRHATRIDYRLLQRHAALDIEVDRPFILSRIFGQVGQHIPCENRHQPVRVDEAPCFVDHTNPVPVTVHPDAELATVVDHGRCQVGHVARPGRVRRVVGETTVPIAV